MQEKVPLAPYVLIALALAGIGDTLYLSYYQYLDLMPSCAIGGCETVLASPLSRPFGVPFGYIGLFYYFHMLGLAALLAYEPRDKGMRLAALLYTGAGFALSLFFEFYIQAYLIGALCLYCGISAILTLLLFGTALYHFRSRI